MKDAVSRRSRGFGFITYMNTASVDAALSVEQHIVDNRRVEAKRAVPRSEVPKVLMGTTYNFAFVLSYDKIELLIPWYRHAEMTDCRALEL